MLAIFSHEPSGLSLTSNPHPCTNMNHVAVASQHAAKPPGDALAFRAREQRAHQLVTDAMVRPSIGHDNDELAASPDWLDHVVGRADYAVPVCLAGHDNQVMPRSGGSLQACRAPSFPGS